MKIKNRPYHLMSRADICLKEPNNIMHLKCTKKTHLKSSLLVLVHMPNVEESEAYVFHLCTKTSKVNYAGNKKNVHRKLLLAERSYQYALAVSLHLPRFLDLIP